MLISYVIWEIPIKTWNTTTYLLEWLKSKTPTVPNADEDVEQREVSLVAAGNAGWFGHFGRQLSSIFKAKFRLTI